MTSTGTHRSEEDLKCEASLRFGTEARNNLHLKTLYNASSGPQSLQEFFDNGLFVPSQDDIDQTIFKNPGAGLPAVLAQTVAIVPCFEPQEEKVEAVLETASDLVAKLGPERVIYIIADVHHDALVGLREMGIQMIFEQDVRNHCDWSALAQLIHLFPEDPERLSRELRGKGVTVMFGLYALFVQKPDLFFDMDWVVLCDSEIQNFAKYKMLDHLMYPAALASMNNEACTFDQLVQAKIGRGNESMCMSLNMLQPLIYSPHVDNQVREAASFIYHALSPMVWYGCGERAIRAQKLPHIPIGGDYTLEIVFDMGIPRRLNENPCLVAQTANPHPRLDGANSPTKEWLMWCQIGKTAHLLATHGVIIPDLKTIEDYARVNREVMGKENNGTMLMLPPDYESGVISLNSRFPRIYPPAFLLHQHNIINL